MKADFSGYATKAGLRCSDGRTIMPGAFKHQDKMKVPLVWQHGHNDPENVLGHAILENREDGVYAYGYFNDSGKANHARSLLEHGDINMLSIWANELIEKAGRVLHGAIREVSLVLSGANPGAIIENVTLRHSNGDEFQLDDEVIIYTGLEIQHSATDADEETEDDETEDNEESEDMKDVSLAHAGGEMTVQDVYESMSEEQKNVLHFLVGEALASAQEGEMAQSALTEESTNQEIYDSLNEYQKDLLHSMLEDAATINKEGTDMTRNIFENNGAKGTALSHEDIRGIVADATKGGSLRDAVESYALAHGITDIDVLFPEAQAVDATPEWLKRRTEWVSKFTSAARKSPFSRIKTLHADITLEDARAKGYVTGAMKKEEYFGVSKRVTTPTTIYKKQRLDRDDMVDITDFDVVTWLKAEMRMMLDEEIARAALIGDGRDVSHEDKINEGNIRPIAKDHELYTTTINVNIDDSGSSVQEVIDAIILNRRHFRGTGMPTMFTTETYISKFLLLKDTLGRRIYSNIQDLANELRVAEIVPVEVMEEEEDLVCVIVNPADYVMGADRGGAISMFDDFDIDYNQHKYLIETRMCGALVKMKSAMVVKKVAGTLVLTTYAAPTFDSGLSKLFIDPTNDKVVYLITVDGVEWGERSVLNGTEFTISPGDQVVVKVSPFDPASYYLPDSNNTFTFDGPGA